MIELYRAMACYVWALCGSPDGELDTETREAFTETGNAIYNEQYGDNGYINAAIHERQTAGPASPAFRTAAMLAIFHTSASPALQTLLMDHPDGSPDGTYIYGTFEGENATPTHMWLRHQGMLYDTIPGVLIRRCVSNAFGNNPPSVNGNEPQADTYRIQLIDLSFDQLEAIANPNLDQH